MGRATPVVSYVVSYVFLLRYMRIVAFLFCLTTSLCCYGQDSNGYYLSVEEHYVHQGSGALAGFTTFRVYLNTLNETDYLHVCLGDEINPMVFTAPEGWYNSPYNAGWNASGINP